MTLCCFTFSELLLYCTVHTSLSEYRRYMPSGAKRGKMQLLFPVLHRLFPLNKMLYFTKIKNISLLDITEKPLGTELLSSGACVNLSKVLMTLYIKPCNNSFHFCSLLSTSLFLFLSFFQSFCSSVLTLTVLLIQFSC